MLPKSNSLAPQRALDGNQQRLASAVSLPLPSTISPEAFRQVVVPENHWSADGWLFLRDGNGPVTGGAVGGTYGASQAGAVLRYRLAPSDWHRPTLYLRGTAALNGVREQEAALGASARPFGEVLMVAVVELRATRNNNGTGPRPAVAVISELPPQALPSGLQAEVYVQAGYVGGRDASAFVDGLVRLDHKLATRLRVGAGAWGGAQENASRLDLGPTASITLSLGNFAGARLGLDWRFRVAGDASPDSGAALTLSAGF
jgi:hypothetical protein